ncbi:unnamed protein product [Closterium sp. NIES-54]
MSVMFLLTGAVSLLPRVASIAIPSFRHFSPTDSARFPPSFPRTYKNCRTIAKHPPSAAKRRHRAERAISWCVRRLNRRAAGIASRAVEARLVDNPKLSLQGHAWGGNRSSSIPFSF